MQGTLEDIARELGKKNPELVVDDAGIKLVPEFRGELLEVLSHLFGNCIDHGIERASDRAEAGKPEQGTIYVGLQQVDGGAELTIYDDGRGLNVDRLRQIGIERQLLQSPESWNEEIARSIIFADEVSTAGKLSLVSGRGVGMAAVRDVLRKYGGEVGVEFRGEADSDGFQPFRLVLELSGKLVYGDRDGMPRAG